ncbi:DUF1302 domain-containing protein [Marinobacterium sp. D7]|uniref:DUF1302 domain-containing protein n=1 Tax=Marinobacterium ramblicola TaxID=2849041 RepID=UPI001C2D1A99|nr:DUF1302 domain-containing protein [Marinobacterium ramblicola]MBV1788276.1 DUF1302 domain-containing protein [Marinobacterium ramblicola]
MTIQKYGLSLGTGVFTIFSALLAPNAEALEFAMGDIQGRFDSQISAGASWRVEKRDSNLIAVPNGGTGNGSGSYDDGNLNFDRGDTFSRTLKGVHELELQRDNLGLFLRGKYWFDFALEQDSHSHGNIPNRYRPDSKLSDEGFNDYAKFSGAELLDAFVYTGFDLGDEGQHPLDLRLGRQVVNWGESAFIQGGLNSFNPVDVSAARRPGALVKDALLPTNQLFASVGLNDALSLEGFYQLEWEPTAIDGCGTYFSTSDFAAEGCDGVRIPLGLTDEQYFDTSFTGLVLGFDPVVYRHADGNREADDSGQFGLALRYFADQLNGTEFGVYLARYHSRLPISSGVNTDSGNVFDGTYYIEYPEDIDLIGLSFNTLLGDLAWSGEISHKRNQPIQINGPLLVGAVLTQFSGGIGNAAADQRVADAGAGGTVSGYDRFAVTQVQSSLIKFYHQVLGASRLSLVGELGWTHVHGLDEGDNAIKYGRAGAWGYSAGDSNGFVTADSVGYVVRSALTYSDIIESTSLTPQISFKHGLYGNGPEPGAAFRKGEKALGLTLTSDYQHLYQLQMGYTRYFGGDYNELSDRDHLSLSASVSF